MKRHLLPLLRRTWIPLGLALALVVGVVVAVPWYYKTFRGTAPDRGLSASELEWVRAYAPWRTHVRDTLARAYANRNSVDGELGRILDELSDCAEHLRVQVGPPPSERLGPVAEWASAACAGAAAALAAYRAAGDTPSWRTSAMLAGAADGVRRAELGVRQLLLSQRRLPERGGPGQDGSRMEPRLSEAVSTDQPTEVLCWSEDEWPQVQAELAAVGLEQDPSLRRDVNAYRFRIHASPAVCRPLAALAYGQPSTPAPEVAHALLALLHAARHAAAGVEDEAAATCDAVRGIARAATRLGAAPADAEALAAQAARAATCAGA